MNIKEHENYIEIRDIERFAPKHTFECGQCFRWFEKDGKYEGVAMGKKLTVWADENALYMTSTKEDFENIWRKYFDLDRSYESIAKAFTGDEFFAQAVEYGLGLRLLKQDPWEALCSFIISQCNNISRIQKIVSTLCENFGEKIEGGYAFPTAEKIALLELSDLDILRSGYRAKYILNAAKAVAEGEISFEKLESMQTDEARKYIMSLNGVGRKVADCFLLFGMAKYDAFPVDTWMKKAKDHYDIKNYGAHFGEFAGIAQQYIFYYARSQKI